MLGIGVGPSWFGIPVLAEVLNDSAYRLAPLKDVASWVAGDDIRYRMFSYTFLLTFFGLAIAGFLWKAADRRLRTPLGVAVVLGLACLTIYGGRWPTFFVKDSLNNDESQAIAQAITALHYPTPWLGFDGNTCGPLNTYALELPALFGFALTFFTTRIIAVLLDFGAVAALYAALSTVVSARIARLASIAPIAFFAFAREEHYVHYTGETLSLFLAALGVACVARFSVTSKPVLAALACGLVVGAMPFAKLQSAPIAVAIFIIAIVVSLVRNDGRATVVRAIAAVTGGSLAIPVAIVGWSIVAGSFHDFWMSYILSSLAYIEAPWPPSFLLASEEFGTYFDFGLLCALAGGVAIVAVRPVRITRIQGAYLASLFFVGATVYAIYAPGRGSENYLLLAVVPIAAAVGTSLGVVFEAFATFSFARVAVPVFAVLALACAPISSLFQSPPWLGSVGNLYASPPDPIVAMLDRYVHPGDRLAVWGWRPEFNVKTQTLIGTRDSITPYQEYINNNPYYAYFRTRYLNDLETDRPVAFLDAGPESFDLANHTADGHEDVPELAAEIRQMYHLVATYKNYRLYVIDS